MGGSSLSKVTSLFNPHLCPIVQLRASKFPRSRLPGDSSFCAKTRVTEPFLWSLALHLFVLQSVSVQLLCILHVCGQQAARVASCLCLFCLCLCLLLVASCLNPTLNCAKIRVALSYFPLSQQFIAFNTKVNCTQNFVVQSSSKYQHQLSKAKYKNPKPIQHILSALLRRWVLNGHCSSDPWNHFEEVIALCF